MGVINTIKSWNLSPSRKFDVLAWDDSDYKGIKSVKQTSAILKNIDTAEYGQCFLKFPDVKNCAYIHQKSVALTPINDWTEFDKIWDSFEKYSKNNMSLFETKVMKVEHSTDHPNADRLSIVNGSVGCDDPWPEYRVLMNMKFRGSMSGGMVLLSDRENRERTVNLPLPKSSFDPGRNECIVFEYELSECAVRNYFYNSSKREFVYLSHPSWIVKIKGQ